MKRLMAIILAVLLIGAQTLLAMGQSAAIGIEAKLSKQVYTPGETVNVEATLRQGTASLPYSVIILKVQQNESKQVIYVEEVKADGKGSIRHGFLLPHDVRPGSYTVELYGGGVEITLSFQVTATASVLSLDKSIYQPGDQIKIQGKAIEKDAIQKYTPVVVQIFQDQKAIFIEQGLTDEQGSFEFMYTPGFSLAAGRYTVEVTLLGKTLEQTFYMALGRVSQPYWVEKVLHWNAIAGTKEYEIKLYQGTAVVNTQAVNANTLALDLGDIIVAKGEGRYTATVQAKGDQSTIYDGAVSQQSTVLVYTVSNPIDPGPTDPIGPGPNPTNPSPNDGGSSGTSGSVQVTVQSSSVGTAKVILEKNQLDVKKDGEKTIIGIPKKVVEAILAALKASDRTLYLELRGMEGLHLELQIPPSLIEGLQGRNMGLAIVAASLEYKMDTAAFQGLLGSNETLAFVSSPVDITQIGEELEASQKIRPLQGVDIEVIVKDASGKKLRNITAFKTPLEVAISLQDLKADQDLLGVYYLNDGKLEFMGGKIRDNKILFRTSHNSEYVVGLSTKTFQDIASHWSQRAVASMTAKNVVSGYPDGTFQPRGLVTRAEFAKLLVTALELETKTYRNMFSDVTNTNWAASYIAAVYEAGIIQGYPDGTFRPNDPITRMEMAVMLDRSLQLKTAKVQVLERFLDQNQIASWAIQSMANVVDQQIMVGDQKHLNPQENVSRAEAATVIYRIY